MLGFFTQLFPCMVLSLIPFCQEDFRFGKKNLYIALFLYGLTTAVIFPFVMYTPFMYHFSSMSNFGSVYMLCVIAVYLIPYGKLLRVQAIKKVLTINLVVFYAATEYLLVNFITPITDETYSTVYLPVHLLLYVACTAVLFPVMAWMMGKIMRPYLSEIEPQNLKRGFWSMIAVSVLSFCIIFVYSSSIPVSRNFWWVFCPPFLLVTVVMIAFYWLMFRESVRRKRDSEYERYAKIQDIQYQKTRQEIDNAARLRHDVRHHYRILYEMALDNKNIEAQKYLSELIEQTAKRENEYYCENQAINALLRYYIGWAKDEGIRCEVQAVCGELKISPIDLSAILGNTIENAIHSCQEIVDNRWLRLTLGFVGNTLALQVENACVGVRLQNGFKADGFLPAEAFESQNGKTGYGLKNIYLSAKRNGGDAQFCYNADKSCFITRVRLNPNGETKSVINGENSEASL